MKFKYILRITLIGVLLYLGITYLDGITLTATRYGIILSFAILLIIFAVIELLLYPMIKMLILPLRIVTLGFASAILSVNLIYIVAFMFPFFAVSSLWQAIVLGVGIGLIRVFTK